MQLSLTFPTAELQGAFPTNAEKLFAILEVNSKFADWIKNRISQYGFIENQDYVVKTTYTGRRPRKEYFITLDMAKELCMVENNERGKEARRYFIKCEQELQALKFRYYVDEISNLRAVQISQGRHNQNVINGYKSQLSQRNALIVDREKQITKLKNKLAFFDAPEFKPFSSSHPSYLELFRLYIEALGKCNALNIRIDGLIMENEKLKRFDKGERITIALAKIQKELERVYSGIGAVMAYASDGDRYFLEHNEITKG